MELTKYTIRLILAAAVLYQSVLASEQIELSQCSVDEDHGPIRQCVVFDSTGDVYYEGEDITALLTLDLPLPILLECFGDLNIISIVTPSGNAMVTGREILSKQDKGRWWVEHTLQPVDNYHGRLNLTLHIQGVTWNDEQLLHVEIRGNNVTYKTTNKVWIDVTRHLTTEDPQPTTEDPQAMKQATIAALENEKLALQQRIMKVQKDLIHCQATNMQSLKCNTTLAIEQAKVEDLKNDKLAQQEEIEKYKKALQDAGRSNGWNIATCLLVAIVVIAAIFYGFKLRSYSLVRNSAISQVDPENKHEYERLIKAC